ncbi:hypothetical protein D3C73_578960 [compost metagenome]
MNMDYKLLESQLYVVTELKSDAIYTIPAVELSDREKLEQFLTFYQHQIKGLDIQVAGTYLAASWRVLCTAIQYMIGVADRWLSFSPENLTIQVRVVNNYPFLFFVVKDSQELSWPEGEKSEWREEWLGRFYQQTIAPVFACISNITGLPLGQVWAQIPLGIEYYVKHINSILEEETHQEELMEQYHFLIRELDPSWFGLHRNPFNINWKWIDDPRREGGKVPMKPTCCLAYRTDTGHGYCYSCPKMTKEQREDKRQQMIAASS